MDMAAKLSGKYTLAGCFQTAISPSCLTRNIPADQLGLSRKENSPLTIRNVAKLLKLTQKFQNTRFHDRDSILL
jgi:hypothetical protein